MEIHRELGPAFKETVYEEVMIDEFKENKIAFENQVKVDIYYKGKKLKRKYQADFIIDSKIVVELKVIPHLGKLEELQMIHYLKATGLKVGLLINFGGKSLEWKRIIY